MAASGLELHKVRLLGLAPSAAHLVLGGNLLRLVARARRRPRGRVAVAVPRALPATPPAGDPWSGEQLPISGR